MEQAKSKILSGLLGVAIADALGVPVKYTSRRDLKQSPITQMEGYGTNNQPPGTWSDCSSIAFCVAESLAEGNWSRSTLLANITGHISHWSAGSLWTARGNVLNMGGVSSEVLQRLEQGMNPRKCGESSDRSSSSGMLTRTLALAYCAESLTFTELMDRVHRVAMITNTHPRSQMACGFYVVTAIALLQEKSPKNAYLESMQRVGEFYERTQYREHLDDFFRLLRGNIFTCPQEEIKSNGHAVETLEAALWCLCNSRSYSEAVLKAVNLGDDTNTTAGVTGGLAGVCYGAKDMSVDWIQQVARFYDILDLATRYARTLERQESKVTVNC